MWTNLAVILFILLQLLFFGSQGLFSAMLHLVLVLLAGALALAAWEPLTLGFLIDRMPEVAWGVGLIAPFVLLLMVMRLVADRLVHGNVMLPQAVNWGGGAAVGVVSGILVAGLGVIGVQFLGGVSLQYTPYTQTAGGAIERDQTLWIPVDDVASSVLGTLSGGAFAPWSGHTVARRHGDLAMAAGTFGQTARPTARRSIRPMNVEVGRMLRLTSARLRTAMEEVELPAEAAPAFDGALLGVETEIDLVGETEAGGAADADGRFTATPAQVALIADEPGGGVGSFHPVGYVVDEAYGAFSDRAAATSSGGASETIVWLFDVPEEVEPRWLRLKQTPLAMPEPASEDEAVAWVGDIVWQPAEAPAAANGEGETAPGRTSASFEDVEIEVTAALPERLSKNWINTGAGGGQYDDSGLVEAVGWIGIQRGERVGGNVLVDHFAPRQGPPVVRVSMTRPQLRGLYGGRSAMARAAELNPPLLISDGGEAYQAWGYAIAAGDTRMYLHFDGRIVRSLSDDAIRDMDADDVIHLYFPVDDGVRLVEFQVDGEGRSLDPPITP